MFWAAFCLGQNPRANAIPSGARCVDVEGLQRRKTQGMRFWAGVDLHSRLEEASRTPGYTLLDARNHRWPRGSPLGCLLYVMLSGLMPFGARTSDVLSRLDASFLGAA